VKQAITAICFGSNADALVFSHLTVNLDMAGSPFATGSSDTPIRLSQRSSTQVPLTVMFTVVNV